MSGTAILTTWLGGGSPLSPVRYAAQQDMALIDYGPPPCPGTFGSFSQVRTHHVHPDLY
ncbi:hypothetical protein LZ32DRAFT_610535 [Colletotrichum eremochloae]|nr:hypothetical protein LZ32DRAFT_610535 [Colletotrichum eremochloae]